MSILSNSEPALCALAPVPGLQAPPVPVPSPGFARTCRHAQVAAATPKPARRALRLAVFPGRNHQNGEPPPLHAFRHFSSCPRTLLPTGSTASKPESSGTPCSRACMTVRHAVLRLAWKHPRRIHPMAGVHACPAACNPRWRSKAHVCLPGLCFTPWHDGCGAMRPFEAHRTPRRPAAPLFLQNCRRGGAIVLRTPSICRFTSDPISSSRLDTHNHVSTSATAARLP